MKKTLLILLVLFVSTAFAAETITITITDNKNPAGTPHYIYHKLSGGNYTTADRVTCPTATCTYSFTSPAAIGDHLFAATAYGTCAGKPCESGFTADATWTKTPQTPDGISITNVSASIFRKDATLIASTDVSAPMKFRYGTRTLSYSKTLDNGGTKHTVYLSGLKPHTTYIYQWAAYRPDGTIGGTLDGSFTTR